MVTAVKMAAGFLGVIIIALGLYLIVLSITYFLSPQGPYLASGVMSMTGGIVLLFMGAYVINKVGWKRK
ncbi:MAG TPA: hypothetical protein VI146_01035 [Nitrososphaeraceae archaeon]